MTYNRDDEPIIQDYQKELQARYQGKEPEDIAKEVIEQFKEGECPKILIVTSKRAQILID
jgi:hypothetical protein